MNLLGIVLLTLIYLLRLIKGIYSYFLLIITGIIFAFYTIITSKIVTKTNYLIEEIAIGCGEDADHVRNLAQFNVSLIKILGSLLLSFIGAFNFWQIHNPYLGKIDDILLLRFFTCLCFNSSPLDCIIPGFQLYRYPLR